MGVYVIDLAGLDSGTLERALHRPARADPGRIGLGQVKIVGRNSVTNDFCQNRRAAVPGRFEIFQGKDRRAFAENQASALAIEGPATFRCRRLQRIEADKHQFGDSVVAAGQDALITTGPYAVKSMTDRVRTGCTSVRDDLTWCADSEGFLRIHHWLLRRVICDQRRRAAVRRAVRLEPAIILFAERHPAAGRADNRELRLEITRLIHGFFHRQDHHSRDAMEPFWM